MPDPNPTTTSNTPSQSVPVINPFGKPEPAPTPVAKPVTVVVPPPAKAPRPDDKPAEEALSEPKAPDSVDEALALISNAISPEFAKKTLEAREPVTPDRSDLARVLLHLARENAKSTKNERAIVLLS